MPTDLVVAGIKREGVSKVLESFLVFSKLEKKINRNDTDTGEFLTPGAGSFI